MRGAFDVEQSAAHLPSCRGGVQFGIVHQGGHRSSDSPPALAASCKPPERPNAGAYGGLASQGTRIGRLAREGQSNLEIAAQLLISPRTVEYHRRKVFAKLDMSSRKQLDSVPLSRLDAS